jgi:hypothetical protein
MDKPCKHSVKNSTVKEGSLCDKISLRETIKGKEFKGKLIASAHNKFNRKVV